MACVFTQNTRCNKSPERLVGLILARTVITSYFIKIYCFAKYTFDVV